MARLPSRYTVYDAMEAKGVFEANPANAASRDPDTGASLYSGPVEFPKMLYHPSGERRITEQATAVSTPFGPKLLGEKREMISKVVKTPAEEAELLEAGWHKTPQRAMAAAGEIELPEDPQDTIARLTAQINELNAAKGEAEAQVLAQPLGVGTKARDTRPAPKPSDLGL
jgi:hypothetical protein